MKAKRIIKSGLALLLSMQLAPSLGVSTIIF